MYTVYIIQSRKDNSYYIGYMEDIERRLSEHNCGLSRYTSQKLPWDLVYTEMYLTKTEALKRELFLKRQKNKTFYQRIITESKQKK
jgi:putative endonuclease